MMATREEVLAYFESAEPTELREVLGKIADIFSDKAEALYDKDPEENGIIAQPYADIADLIGEASLTFERPDVAVDARSKDTQNPAIPTVSQVVAKKVTGNPWGGR